MTRPASPATSTARDRAAAGRGQAPRPGSRAGRRAAGRRRSGIGHTRWATHGAPTVRNAHPQTAGRVTLVHNGIIENFAELKAELIAEGRSFESDTDTEVVAHLIDRELGARRRRRWPRSRRRWTGSPGAYALAVLVEGEAEPGAGRAARQPAGGRLWRWRDVHRLGRARGRPFHQTGSPIWRTGTTSPSTTSAPDLRRCRRAGRIRPVRTVAGLRRPGGEGQLPPLHGKGDPRPAGRLPAHPVGLCGSGRRPTLDAGRGLRAASSGCRSSPAAPRPTPG